MKTPFLGSSYLARSTNAAANRCVNLFPEAVSEGGKEAGYLLRAPGLELKLTVGAGPIRGLWARKSGAGSFYVVSGTKLYALSSLAGPATEVGTVSGVGPVSIADNGTQLFIACDGPSYIYNTSTSAFQQITDPDFPGAGTVYYLDGYFVFNEPDTQRIWVTSLLDGTAVDPLDFASAEGSPDGVVAIAVDHRELWVYGTDSIEVWYNAALPDFPFERIQGAFNEIGCAAPFSIAKLDNTLFWLGADSRGAGIVYKNAGYSGMRISTHAIEFAIQGYSTISDAIAYTYQQEGHAFYVLTFPTANATWVYDVSTGSWHERAGFVGGEFTRHRSNCHCNFNGTTLVGDFENGNIYAFSLDVFQDNGAVQKWLRSWRALPTGRNNLKRTTQHSLQFDAEAGIGLNVGQGSDPEVMLRWSDDGGHTWGNEHWNKMGKLGEYGYRTIWRRLGMTEKLRDRVYEVSGTDPIKLALMGAELIVSPTTA